MTISFGHGMMTTPLQTAVGAAALMNGGKLIEPTFLPRTEAQAARASKQVIHPQVSADMRHLYRLNSTAPWRFGPARDGIRPTVSVARPARRKR